MNNEGLSDKKDLPKWPESLPIPDRVEMTAMHVLDADDLKSDDDIRELVSLMYAHQEREFYLFLEQGESANRAILDRLEGFGLLSDTSEFYYYRHPNSERSYIRIQSNEIKFDWEKKVVDKGPVFVRKVLKLSQATTRSLIIQEQITIEKIQDVNPLELKPNFFGIGLDLSKFWRWGARWFRKRQ